VRKQASLEGRVVPLLTRKSARSRLAWLTLGSSFRQLTRPYLITTCLPFKGNGKES